VRRQKSFILGLL